MFPLPKERPIQTTTIVCGDCIDGMANLDDKSVAIVVTSPPYNIDLAYNSYRDQRDDYIAWSLQWLEQAMRISRKGVMLNLGARSSDQNQLFILMGEIAKRWKIQNTVVWVKSIHVEDKTYGHFKPVNSKRYVNNCHEYVFHLTEDGNTEIDRLAIGVPYTDKSNIGRFNHASDMRCRGTNWFVPYETRQKADSHPAMYPVELARRMIAFAGGNGIVVDPFLGSGTTGIASHALGRSFVGFEIDPVYADIARRRLGLDQESEASSRIDAADTPSIREVRLSV